MVAAGRRPATVNRRLDALRRLCRWARGTGALSADATSNVRPMRTIRNRQPVGLTDIESHALLRAAGASSHGLATRNYALVQLMLQAGLRVGEVATLHVGDITMNDRSGSVRIRQGKGLKARDVPLNATARRALKQHIEHRQAPDKTVALFVSSQETAMPVRPIQSVIASIARRARLNLKRFCGSAPRKMTTCICSTVGPTPRMAAFSPWDGRAELSSRARWRRRALSLLSTCRPVRNLRHLPAQRVVVAVNGEKLREAVLSTRQTLRCRLPRYTIEAADRTHHHATAARRYQPGLTLIPMSVYAKTSSTTMEVLPPDLMRSGREPLPEEQLYGPDIWVPSDSRLGRVKTHWGTVIFADAKRGTVRHGPKESSPRNMMLAEDKGMAYLLHVMPDGTRYTAWVAAERQGSGKDLTHPLISDDLKKAAE